MTQAAIRAHLGLSKSQASYRVNRLLRMGYLSNLEEREGRPQQVVPGTPLPDEVPPLPSPCEVAEWVVKVGRSGLVLPWVDPVTGEAHNCADHIEMLRVLPDRTPEPCRRCVSGPYFSGEGSDTNRTPELSPAAVSGGSGGSDKAEPLHTSYELQSECCDGSVVRSEDDVVVL